MVKEIKCEECGGSLGDYFFINLNAYSLPMVCTKCAKVGIKENK